MAIEYQLKFAEGVAPSELAGWLRTAGFEDTRSPATFTAPGLTATIAGAEDKFGRWRPLGFIPHVQVFFGHDKSEPYEDVMVRLADTIGLLLNELPADAGMAFDNEVVLLLRLRGDLVLTNRDDWWIRPTFEPRLAERLKLPYRLEPLPVI